MDTQCYPPTPSFTSNATQPLIHRAPSLIHPSPLEMTARRPRVLSVFLICCLTTTCYRLIIRICDSEQRCSHPPEGTFRSDQLTRQDIGGVLTIMLKRAGETRLQKGIRFIPKLYRL